MTEVEELGILDRSITVFTPPNLITKELYQPAKRFAELVNEKLKQSQRKDIYIYVHGYKVVFENPILVATELWHFLGYDGVFIAYAWPSTPKTLAYVTDAESAAAGNGHAYFRKSPWTSSDILMTLMHDLRPDERGLVRSEDIPIWTFPPDYIHRLRAALLEALPDAEKKP